MFTLRPLPWLLVLVVLGACGGNGGGPDPGPDPDPPFDPPLASDVRLDTDPPGAALSVFPRIAAEGDALFVAWYDRRNGRTDIYFNRSPDGGATWQAVDTRLDTDAPGAAASSVPRIANDGPRVVVAWEDARSLLSEIRVNRSLDGGATWLADDVRLDRGVVDGSSFEADVAIAGDRVYVVWQDARSGEPDIHLNRSDDGGTTWLAEDVRLDTDPPGSGRSLAPRVVAEGNRVLVVWEDDRDGAFDVRLNLSVDGGATWLPDDLRLDTDVAGDAASRNPRIALFGSTAVVVWQDERPGVFEIRANRSADGGSTWQPADVLVDRDPARTTDALRPSVAVLQDDVLVVWEDGRNGLADVYANRSADGGATWLGVDLRLDTDPPGTARSLTPVAALTATRGFVTFADDREGGFDALLQVSTDGGLTWSDKEVVLNTDRPGRANAVAPQLVGAGDEARAVWYDDRDGEADIRFNRAR